MTVPGGQRVEPAMSGDVVALHRLRRQLEDWLHDKGVRQWPRGEVSQDEIAAQVSRQEWHLARHSEVGVAAAMRMLWSDPDFWGEDSTPAVYVHGLMVDRAMAGLGMGALMLDRAAEVGRDRSVGVFRLDCAESNSALRSYCRKQGFHESGRCDFDDLFSVTLFEKEI
ncbi:GNAT family N-acetyltransferase [Halopolyspora algeriensis]|uniref:GNAT family N-acetyltransferase n=1 Tax=Halopolyspora algeriensis TaxID=1500506 RepID=UPI001FEBCD6F|nr:GNAT family N-acetyltransferase [Halopolyspora algeriensis]